jgi:cellulose biosynthesis protein BcsQ
VITVWNQAGGVGKTTVATNLAFLAAEQGYRTLLVGLGGPDYVPLIIKGLKKRPNLTGWHSNPTPEGLRAVVQKWSQNLHVVAGFPDMFSKGEYLDIGDDQPASIPNLAGTAIQEGYSVLIFDASPSHIAASALAAANHVVLVARPSQENVYRTAVAYQTITERLEGSYRVDPENIRILLNRARRRHGLAPDVWHARVSRMTADHFPPLSATIPEIPEVSDYQDKRTFPVQQEETFREALMPLANSLFGDHGQVYQKEVTFLGIKFRW